MFPFWVQPISLLEMSNATFTRQTKVGKLVFSWQTQVGVCERRKNSQQTRWQTIGDK